MRRAKPEIPVRWIDSKTGEDITERMNDPSIRPGEGILNLARALARLAAAEDFEAGQQLLRDVAAEMERQADDGSPVGWSPVGAPQTGDQLTVNGMTYRYDGATGDGEHFTRLKGDACREALVSLRRGSPPANWMLRRLAP